MTKLGNRSQIIHWIFNFDVEKSAERAKRIIDKSLGLERRKTRQPPPLPPKKRTERKEKKNPTHHTQSH